MRREPRVLFDNGDHICLQFDNLVTGEGVQSNQFLIIDHQEHMLIDPGGNLTYTPLSMEVAKHIPLKNLTYVFASHQDPDIIASLDKWLLHTSANVLCSRLWSRFLPHLMANFLVASRDIDLSERIQGIADKGQSLRLGESYLKLVPAHFLHSVGNFQVYDPVSKILFSGDMGASLVEDAEPVDDFNRHIPFMEAFHRRYMANNKVCQLWANMVKQLDLEMIVPQHGRPFVGKERIADFVEWVEHLRCGIDLLSEDDYRIPN